MAILPDVSNILAQLYTDRLAAYRYESSEDDDGAVETVLEATPVLEGVPCRLSYTGKDQPARTTDGNPTMVNATVICRPDVPLQSGDYLVVTRDGAELYSGRIGRPNRYGSSLQAAFTDEDVS